MQLPISQYTELLQKKTEKLTALLQPFNAPEIAVFDSPTSHYRMRAEFRIWHDKGDFYHIMFDQTTLQRYRVDEFPIASELINRMMKALLPLLKTQEVLHKKLFQIDYLSTLSNKIIVSLLYHKQLTEEWQSAAANLKGELQQLGFDVQLIGRASKQKICLEQDFVDEVLPVKGRNYVYRQVENSFTQPNAAVNCKMLEWAIDCTQGSQGDLLELYCANSDAVENPEKNVPIAVLGGTLGAAVIYIVSTNVIAGIVPNLELANSTAPFGLAFAHMFDETIGKVIMA